MARPRKHVDKKDYPKVTAWAAQGLSDVQIAERLNMSEPTFRERRAQNADLEQAYKVGRAEEEGALVNTLATQARDPDHPKSTIAAIFLLKARHRYSDQPDPTPSIQVTNNTLNLKFPSRVRGKDLSKVVHEYTPGDKAPEALPHRHDDEPINERRSHGVKVGDRVILRDLERRP